MKKLCETRLWDLNVIFYPLLYIKRFWDGEKILDETHFVESKYTFKIIMSRQLCNIFNKKMYKWIINILRNSLSLKDVPIDHRKIILLIATKSGTGKPISRQIISYYLTLANYVLFSEMPDPKFTQQLIASVFMRERLINHVFRFRAKNLCGCRVGI